MSVILRIIYKIKKQPNAIESLPVAMEEEVSESMKTISLD